MQLNSILKIIGQMTIRSDFKEYFTKSLAEGEFMKSQFEDVPTEELQMEMQEPEEEDQFTLEADEPQENNSIKTYQFNSSMVAPSINLPPVNKKPPKIDLPSMPCLFYGYNSKAKNTYIGIHQNIGFRACGCSLFLCKDYHVQKPSDIKLYLSHKYPINVLKYLKDKEMLISGSIGRHPEVFVWKYSEETDDELGQLQLIHKFRLPRKSEGVSLVDIFKENYIIAVDTISLHRSCSLYFFDLNEEVKIQPLKLGGKAFDLATKKQQISIVNDKGVLVINEESGKIGSFISKSGLYTGVALVSAHGAQNYVYCDTEGNLSFDKEKYKIHTGWINMILSENNRIFSSGADEGVVKVSQVDEKWKIIFKFKISMETYCTSLNIVNNNLLSIGGRDGSTQLFNIFQQKPIRKYIYIGSHHNQAEKCFYSKHCERLIFPILKDRLSKALMISLESEKNKKQSIIECQIKSNTIKVDLYGNQLAQVFHRNNKHYSLWITDITDTQKYKQVKFETEDKPTFLKYDGNKAIIGDNKGYIWVIRMKDKKIIKSTENHVGPIQNIIMEKTSHFLKTISKSQLFYWEIKENSTNFDIIKMKPKVVKECQWNKVAKYGWQCKKIWDYMTHFQDISSVDMLKVNEQSYLCLAMFDGNLRIYNFPPAKNNFVEFKLFDGPFEIICERNWLICWWKGMAICYDIHL